jgi:2-(1,2-epoxy-1,2-dihydrophenyl)acetyl-CoA isomerase
MATQLVTTTKQGPVLVIRLSSPENRNSLTTALRHQLGEAVELAERDASVRSVFFTANGPTFCSGGDFKMLQSESDPWSVHRRFRSLSRWLIPLIALEKPVVVGVQGHAVGGGMGLALTGDVVIAGENSKFISGFFRLGVVPDVGMMYHLPRLIGMARAKNFLFSGATLSAREAHALGLVAKVVADDDVEAAGMAEAMRLAEGPAQVIGLAKMLMARSFETSLADMFAFEGFGQVLAMSNPEFREGLTAAIDKRPADFVGAAQQSENRGGGDSPAGTVPSP